MSLRFIYGRAGTGKTNYCLNAIKKRIDDEVERPLIFLVPEQFSFGAEKNLLNMVGEKGTLKAEVLSFKRMAYRVFNEVGGLTLTHMNDSGKSMLIYNIMKDNTKKLRVFKKSSKMQGFVTKVSDLISEFKRYNITPKELFSNIDNIEEDSLKNKIYDLALIFEEFEDRLHKNYIDSDDDLTLLYDKLDKSKRFDNAEIWIDEFTSFTLQQYGILEKLLSKAYRINITLCTDYLNKGLSVDSTDVFGAIKGTEDKFIKIIEENNIKLDKPIALKCDPCFRFKENIELQHMEKNLFSYPYSEFKGETKDISIFKSSNKYTEIENTAIDIIRLCREKNCRFKEIAVITGDLEGYESIVKAIFKEYNIPHFIDEKREINNNPLILIVISAIEILSKNWSYESVFRYLKTGLLNIDKDCLSLLENYVLYNGIRGYKWIEDKDWEYDIPDNYNVEDDKKEKIISLINETRYKIVNPLLEFYKDLKKDSNVKEMCESLYNFLCHIKLPEKIEELIENFNEKKEIEKVNEYNQIWNIIIDVLDQLVEVIGDKKISLKEFTKILQTGFSEYEIGLIPPTLDQVIVGNIKRLRSHNIKVLYIVGVNDGIFPLPALDDGIINDSNREYLSEKGMEIGKDSKSVIFEDQYLVYSTLTTPNKYLRLSYPISTIEGKTLRPSIIISRLKKIFPNICEESDIVNINNDKEDLKNISLPKPTFGKLISRLRKDVDDSNVNSLWADVYKWYHNNEKWDKKLDTVIKGFEYTNQSEYIDTKKIRKLYGKHLTVSVSRIEKFSKCPFSYFVQYGLKAKDRKIYNLTYPDIGILMHGVLEDFSKKLENQNLTWDNLDMNWAEKEIDRCIETQLDKNSLSILNSSKRYKYITESVKKILRRSVWIIGKQIKQGEFKPKNYEVSFDVEGDYPPISISLHSGENVNLIGRIDRVDLLEKDGVSYLRIIDYKSGTKEFKLSEVYYGIQIQLLIYLDAILTEIENRLHKKAEPGAMLYLKLDDPLIKNSKDMSDEEIEKNIIKHMKMKGLLLNDPDVIKDMDKLITGISDIIPAMMKKDGSISTSRSSVADEREFYILRRYVRKIIVEICEEMLEGNIKISPYKNKDVSSCDYCIYSPICKFDTEIKDNNYNILNDKKDGEIWTLMEEKINKD
ncbi:helicase-exonuclease AddAB subunit AddB [Clostridium oceanicum]|uniref:ATP-dependent helicase/deoxyribonuclease subunit B n=1 Tax=Clostridium oceanicum TaxID=1543 RepID=A0ABN1JH77_9CLOT